MLPTCPSLEELEQLVTGDETGSATADHVASCERCQRELERIRANNALVPDLLAVRETVDVRAAATPPADVIPGYKILKELHRGGQGVVFQAIQLSTKRKVALKVMLEGPFAGPASKRRFEREIELIASLRHPHIVPIFDSGAAPAGFYYAMEYIRGRPLSDYVQARKLSVRETLALFVNVCDAVDYAHQRGVIHRDLKPTNILVDERGDPFVLDFGLAKVGGPEADGQATAMLVSVTGQVLGTPAYMSPEQAAGRPHEIDMRSDVYALGVISYELLTGQLPYDITGSTPDTLRTIQQTEPRRLRTIRRKIDDEVETIVLKALSKQKDRRYNTAGALGQDISRFLDGEPIEAKRDSALYVLRKTLRRYKLPATVATAFVILVTASAVALSILYFRAESSAQSARVSQIAETVARREAEGRVQDLRRNRSLQSVRLAQVAYEGNNIRLSRELLDQCPEDLRGWEWHHVDMLHTLCEWNGVTFARDETGGITALAFTPDGTSIVTGSDAGSITVWNVATSEKVVWKAHAGRVLSVAVPPHGSQLVSGSDDGTAKVWDLTTGKLMHPLPVDPRPVSAVAGDTEGHWIAVGMWGGDVYLFDAAGTFRWKKRARSGWDNVFTLAFTPDGKRVCAGSEGQITLFDVDGDDQQAWSHQLETGGVFGLAYSRDGEQIATSGGVSLEIKVRGSDGRERQTLRGHTGYIQDLLFLPNGGTLVSASTDNTIRLWDTATGREVRTLRGHLGGVTSLDLSPDGSRIASGSADGTIRLWHRSPQQEPLELRGDVGMFNQSLALSPDGRWIVAGHYLGYTAVWDLATGVKLRHLLPNDGAVWSLAFSPNSKLLAAGRRLGDNTGDPGMLTVWDLETWQRVWEERYTRAVGAVAFSPDGTMLAATGVDENVDVWDVATQRKINSLPAQRSEIDPNRDRAPHEGWAHGWAPPSIALAWSPDGKILSCAGEDRVIRLWDVPAGRLRPSRSAHEAPVDALVFAPNGKWLASSGRDGLVRIWDAVTNREQHRVAIAYGWARALAVSSSGTRLLTGAGDGTVRLWDTATWQEVIMLGPAMGPVFQAAISPDEKRILTTGWGWDVRIWNSDLANRHDDPQVLLRRIREIQPETPEWTVRYPIIVSLIDRYLVLGILEDHRDTMEELIEFLPADLDWPTQLPSAYQLMNGLKALGQLGAEDEARAYIHAIIERSRRRRSKDDPQAARFFDALKHYVTTPQHWRIVGPFSRKTPNEHLPREPALQVEGPIDPGDKYEGSTGLVGWSAYSVWPWELYWVDRARTSAVVDLLRLGDADAQESTILRPRHYAETLGSHEIDQRYPSLKNVVGYGLTYLHVPEEGDFKLRIRSDDGVRAWLNDELVHTANNASLHAFSLPPDRNVQLEKGSNKLLLEIENDSAGWAFSVQVFDAGGWPARVKWSTDPTVRSSPEP